MATLIARLLRPYRGWLAIILFANALEERAEEAETLGIVSENGKHNRS